MGSTADAPLHRTAGTHLRRKHTHIVKKQDGRIFISVCLAFSFLYKLIQEPSFVFIPSNRLAWHLWQLWQRDNYQNECVKRKRLYYYNLAFPTSDDKRFSVFHCQAKGWIWQPGANQSQTGGWQCGGRKLWSTAEKRILDEKITHKRITNNIVWIWCTIE